MADIQKINLRELGARAGSIEADLAIKMNEIIDELQTRQEAQLKVSSLREPKRIPVRSHTPNYPTA